jgi:hypothetical protein
MDMPKRQIPIDAVPVDVISELLEPRIEVTRFGDGPADDRVGHDQIALHIDEARQPCWMCLCEERGDRSTEGVANECDTAVPRDSGDELSEQCAVRGDAWIVVRRSPSEPG